MCRKAAEDLAKEVVMLNFAATENSSYALCQATMLLARHPEWLDAIWEEQKELIAQYGEDTIDRKVHIPNTPCLLPLFRLDTTFDELLRPESSMIFALVLHGTIQASSSLKGFS